MPHLIHHGDREPSSHLLLPIYITLLLQRPEAGQTEGTHKGLGGQGTRTPDPTPSLSNGFPRHWRFWGEGLDQGNSCRLSCPFESSGNLQNILLQASWIIPGGGPGRSCVKATASGSVPESEAP